MQMLNVGVKCVPDVMSNAMFSTVYSFVMFVVDSIGNHTYMNRTIVLVTEL